jgi:hypothetical protein
MLQLRARGPIIKSVRMSTQTLELFKDSPLRNTSCSPFPFGVNSQQFYNIPIYIDEDLADGVMEPEYG